MFGLGLSITLTDYAYLRSLFAYAVAAYFNFTEML